MFVIRQSSQLEPETTCFSFSLYESLTGLSSGRLLISVHVDIMIVCNMDRLLRTLLPVNQWKEMVTQSA